MKFRRKPLIALALVLGLILTAVAPSTSVAADLPLIIFDGTKDKYPTEEMLKKSDGKVHMYPDTSTGSSRIRYYSLPAYSTNDPNKNGDKVSTGVAMRTLPIGHHYYTVMRTDGEWVPVVQWVDNWEKHTGIHNTVGPLSIDGMGKLVAYATSYLRWGLEMEEPEYIPITLFSSKTLNKYNGIYLTRAAEYTYGSAHGEICTREISDGWVPVCAYCGNQITSMLHYTTPENIAKVTKLCIGDYYISYCPYDGMTEQAAPLSNHKCYDPTPNRFRIQYIGGPEASNMSTAFQTNYYSPDKNLSYEGGPVTQEYLTLQPNLFTSTDYVFVGYSKTKGTTYTETSKIIDGSANVWQYVCGSGTIDIAQDSVVNLYAVWKPITKTLKLDANGGKFTENNAASIVRTGTMNASTTAPLPQAPNGKTLTLNGNGGTIPSLGNVTSKSVAIPKVFAGWTADPDPLNGALNLDNNTYVFGSHGAYTDILTASWQEGGYVLPTASKSGYFFTGWYYDASCTQMCGTAGQTIYPSSNITIYAGYDGVALTAIGNWRTKTIDYNWNALHISNGAYSLFGSNANSNSIDKQLNRSGTDQSVVASVDKTLTSGSYTAPNVNAVYEITVNGAKGGNYSGHSGGNGASIVWQQAISGGTVFTMSTIAGGGGTSGGSGGAATQLTIGGTTSAIAGGGGGANSAADGKSAQGLRNSSGTLIKGSDAGTDTFATTQTGAAGVSGGGGGYKGGAKGSAHNHSVAGSPVTGGRSAKSDCYSELDTAASCIATMQVTCAGRWHYAPTAWQVFFISYHSKLGGQRDPDVDYYTDLAFPASATDDIIGGSYDVQFGANGGVDVNGYFDDSGRYVATDVSDALGFGYPESYTPELITQMLQSRNFSVTSIETPCWKHGTVYKLTCTQPEASPSYGGSSYIASYINNSLGYSVNSTGNSVHIKSLVTDYSTATAYQRTNSGDINAPYNVSAKSQRSNDRTYFTLTWSPSSDTGTNYKARLDAVNLSNTNENASSDAVTTTQFSDLKGYFYKIDTSATASAPALSGWQMNENWNPTSISGWTFTKSTQLKAQVKDLTAGSVNYLHVFAVDNAGNVSAVANAPMNLSGETTPNGYTLKFDKVYDDATYTGSKSRTMEIGKTTSKTEPASRPGYIFDGWYTEVDGGTKLFDPDGNTMVDGTYFDTKKQWIYTARSEVTVYAHYVPVTTDIVLHRNGVVGTEASETYDLHYTYGTAHKAVDNILNWSRLGYTLEGWALTQEKANSKPAINRTADWATRTEITNQFVLENTGKTTHLWAVWKPIKYTIVWMDPVWQGYTDRPEGPGSHFVEKEYVYDEEYGTETQSSVNMYHKGYYIGGWSVDESANTTDDNYDAHEKNFENLIRHYTLFNEASQEGAVITLNALWFPNRYKVVYHSNNSTYNSNTGRRLTAEDTFEQQMTYDSPALIERNPWTRSIVASDSKFIGWSLDKDYASVLLHPKTLKDFYWNVDNLYQERQQVMNLTAVRDGVVHLYAIYDDPPVIKTSNLTLTFDQIVKDTTAEGDPIWKDGQTEVKENDLIQYVIDNCVKSVTDDTGGTLWSNKAFGNNLQGHPYTKYQNDGGLSLVVNIDVQTIAYNSYYNRVTGWVVSAIAIDSSGQRTMATFTITVSDGYNIMVAAS